MQNGLFETFNGRLRDECLNEHLFPDGYTDVPYRGCDVPPDGPRYKALGISMACNAMEWIGARIDHVRRELGE